MSSVVCMKVCFPNSKTRIINIQSMLKLALYTSKYARIYLQYYAKNAFSCGYFQSLQVQSQLMCYRMNGYVSIYVEMFIKRKYQELHERAHSQCIR